MAAEIATLKIESATFEDGKTVPKSMVFSGMGAGGDNISPQLSWSGAPAGTKSYALTLWDPDAPTTVGYWHWIVFNIPPSVTSIEAGKAPAGAVEGYTDFGMSAYGGPAPPPGHGPHRYQIRIFALDLDSIPMDKGTTGATLMFIMREHILAQGLITGIYER